jgi:hypothetical protein
MALVAILDINILKYGSKNGLNRIDSKTVSNKTPEK